MIGLVRNAVNRRKLSSRKRKLELRRDQIISSMVNDNGSHLFRHEYPNTPILEDVFLELEYVDEALAGITGYGSFGAQATA